MSRAAAAAVARLVGGAELDVARTKVSWVVQGDRWENGGHTLRAVICALLYCSMEVSPADNRPAEIMGKTCTTYAGVGNLTPAHGECDVLQMSNVVIVCLLDLVRDVERSQRVRALTELFLQTSPPHTTRPSFLSERPIL